MSTNETQKKYTKFEPSMLIIDALNLHPEASLVLDSYHLGGCSSCSMNNAETIGEACVSYSIPVENIIDSLNNLLD